MSDDRIVTTDPSYGMIRVGTINCGGGANLYGSNIKHDTVIEIKICNSEHIRNISNDWYHATDRVAVVQMSQSQFAEMLTTQDGNGVPCTIKYSEDRGRVEYPDIEGKFELLQREFKADLQHIADYVTKTIKHTEEAFAVKGTVKKKDRENIVSELKMLRQKIISDLPFVYDMFNEEAEKTILEAKGEIDASIEHKIRSLGIEVLSARQAISDVSFSGDTIEFTEVEE